MTCYLIATYLERPDLRLSFGYQPKEVYPRMLEEVAERFGFSIQEIPLLRGRVLCPITGRRIQENDVSLQRRIREGEWSVAIHRPPNLDLGDFWRAFEEEKKKYLERVEDLQRQGHPDPEWDNIQRRTYNRNERYMLAVLEEAGKELGFKIKEVGLIRSPNEPDESYQQRQNEGQWSVLIIPPSDVRDLSLFWTLVEEKKARRPSEG